ncbi:MAG: hypothetical protein ACXVHB_19080 [Solirubrobacteraceae bacterium]
MLLKNKTPSICEAAAVLGDAIAREFAREGANVASETEDAGCQRTLRATGDLGVVDAGVLVRGRG